jgi:hypothetical protein
VSGLELYGPFKSPEELEKAIAPYMRRRKPRHLHYTILGETLWARMMRMAIGYMEHYKERRCKSTFAKFIRAHYAYCVYLDDGDHEVTDLAAREFFRLYGVAL